MLDEYPNLSRSLQDLYRPHPDDVSSEEEFAVGDIAYLLYGPILKRLSEAKEMDYVWRQLEKWLKSGDIATPQIREFFMAIMFLEEWPNSPGLKTELYTPGKLISWQEKVRNHAIALAELLEDSKLDYFEYHAHQRNLDELEEHGYFDVEQSPTANPKQHRERVNHKREAVVLPYMNMSELLQALAKADESSYPPDHNNIPGLKHPVHFKTPNKPDLTQQHLAYRMGEWFRHYTGEPKNQIVATLVTALYALEPPLTVEKIKSWRKGVQEINESTEIPPPQ